MTRRAEGKAPGVGCRVAVQTGAACPCRADRKPPQVDVCGVCGSADAPRPGHICPLPWGAAFLFWLCHVVEEAWGLSLPSLMDMSIGFTSPPGTERVAVVFMGVNVPHGPWPSLAGRPWGSVENPHVGARREFCILLM